MALNVASILMTVFIGLVIVAGLFGPYMISVILAILAGMCLWSVNRDKSVDL